MANISMEAPQEQSQQSIDELLERYLGLLDTYASLRHQLSALQSGVYQNIARANFAAERGARFGQDYYDERMQASRTLELQSGQDGVPIFAIKDVAAPRGEDASEAEAEAEAQGGKQRKKIDSNPLRWFGLFAPTALRTAQELSTRAVGDVIPRLLSVSAEMADVEIQVRRARKRRAKTALAAERQADAERPAADAPASSEAIASTG